MNKNITIVVVVLVVVASVLLGFFTARGNRMMRRGGGAMMGEERMMRREMANVDRHFIEQMIPHHEGAIAMAELALQKGKHSELRSLAENIIEAQESEIVQMKSWYEEWFGKQVPVTSHEMIGGMNMAHMGSMSGDLETLASSKDFDKEFIRQMIPHHEMAVMMATMMESGTKRKEMKELADNIITSQSREIDMMRSWLALW